MHAQLNICVCVCVCVCVCILNAIHEYIPQSG